MVIVDSSHNFVKFCQKNKLPTKTPRFTMPPGRQREDIRETITRQNRASGCGKTEARVAGRWDAPVDIWQKRFPATKLSPTIFVYVNQKFVYFAQIGCFVGLPLEQVWENVYFCTKMRKVFWWTGRHGPRGLGAVHEHVAVPPQGLGSHRTDSGKLYPDDSHGRGQATAGPVSEVHDERDRPKMRLCRQCTLHPRLQTFIQHHSVGIYQRFRKVERTKWSGSEKKNDEV